MEEFTVLATVRVTYTRQYRVKANTLAGAERAVRLKPDDYCVDWWKEDTEVTEIHDEGIEDE